MNILETRELSKSFGGMVAVDGLTMEVEEGSITGLIGPNGAGKSTAFNLISGMLSPDAGSVVFRGDDVTNFHPSSIARRGIARTFQQARVFDRMTVRENLEVVSTDVSDQEAEVDRLVSFVELEEEVDSYAGDLSGGQQVLVGLARTLMLQPDLLLLDEPFAGVNPGLVMDIMDMLRKLREEEDVTVFIVDHEIDEIADLCDEIIVMAEGKKLIKGLPESVLTDERVVSTYLGGGR